MYLLIKKILKKKMTEQKSEKTYRQNRMSVLYNSYGNQKVY